MWVFLAAMLGVWGGMFRVLVMAISRVAVCESWCVAGRCAGNEVGLCGGGGCGVSDG